MAYFLAEEETLDDEGLKALQSRKLAALLAAILPGNLFYGQKLRRQPGFSPGNSPRVVDLPFTTRGELEADQRAHPPYGTNLTFSRDGYTRLHQTSGSQGAPLRWLDTRESWEWFKRSWRTVYAAGGVDSGDRVAFLFSFGPFIGFWGAFEAAADLGAFCLAGGGMTTVARLSYIIDNEATVLCCTPTYALRMIETAVGEDIEISEKARVRRVIVAGEPGGNIPATRKRIEDGFGARVLDHAGMTEIGAWGFECEESPGALHVNEAEFIAEVVDPASGELVAAGQAGELVLTNLGRTGSPLIRYRTGDVVRLIRGRCACGRWFARAEGGILGRVDDMLLVRGNNVFPTAIEAIVREFREVVEFRLNVRQRGAMTDLEIVIEPVPGADDAALATRVSSAVRDRLHFQPSVTLAPPDSLPRFEMKAKRINRGE